MSSNDQLIKALSNIVKLPDKFEVEGYCASVVIIIANVLSDGEHLTPILSHGMPHFAEQYLIILSHCLRVENMTI
jgi:hypothetical protein